MRDLLALYDDVVRALDARALARAASARAPRPAPGGRLVVLGLGKVAAELYEGARGEGEALLVVPPDARHCSPRLRCWGPTMPRCC